MHFGLTFGPNFADTYSQYSNLNQARREAMLFSDRKRKNQVIRVYKYTKVKGTFDSFYEHIVGKVHKNTDPDGLVVFTYQEVIALLSGHDFNTGKNTFVYRDGPLRLIKPDGTLGKMVSYNRWSDEYRERY